MTRAAVLVIQAYRKYISNSYLHYCKFTPSCSEYAVDALNRYGFLRGLLRTVSRISRCHPFATPSYDPVK